MYNIKSDYKLLLIVNTIYIAQSAGAVEYTDCTSIEK